MRDSQRGQAIILIAVMLGVVVGMAALAIDGSRAYSLRRDLQNAVDYAALGAADSYQRSNSFASAESTAATDFGIQMRLYSGTTCTAFGSPGPGTYNVTCTYSDGTTLGISVPVRGPSGAQFNLTASKVLALQFGRILTNGSSPTISTVGGSRVDNLLYSPTLAALDQAGCGGAGGTAISINGSGQLQVSGDVVSDGTISVSSGSAPVTGDVYARCQAGVSGVSTLCYPSGSSPACSYPDVAGAFRSGYNYADPGYPTPGPVGGGQGGPANTVLQQPGVYSVLATVAGRCYFLAGGVYEFQSGFLSLSGLVSNELKPPDEPASGNVTQLAPVQFWNTGGVSCAGSAQYQAVQCNGSGNCGTGNCGQGIGQGNGCTAAPPGIWAFEITSVRTDTFGGNSYFRESAPSTCQTVTVGNHQAIQLTVSNVPGATAYNIYAAPPGGGGCAGPFGLAESLSVSVPVQNNSLGGCPAFTGTTCSLGFEGLVLNGNDIGSPFAPNAGAAADTLGAAPPTSEAAPLGAGLPNQNPARLSGSQGDRANENNCETTGGTFATCPSAITPGAVVFYLPAASCFVTTNLSDTYLFSGYQFNWLVLYEPASNGCANTYGSNVNSALIGLVYTPGASFAVIDKDTFDAAGTGGVTADTLSFTGTLPAITFSSAYAPVPFAARLVS